MLIKNFESTNIFVLFTAGLIDMSLTLVSGSFWCISSSTSTRTITGRDAPKGPHQKFGSRWLKSSWYFIYAKLKYYKGFRHPPTTRIFFDAAGESVFIGFYSRDLELRRIRTISCRSFSSAVGQICIFTEKLGKHGVNYTGKI